MADIMQDDLFNIYRDHGTIRRDLTREASDIRREVAQEACSINQNISDTECAINSAVKDARHDNIVATDNVGDRLISQLDKQFHAQQNTLTDMIRDNLKTQCAVETTVLKNSLEAKNNTQYLADKITHEAEKTRELINSLQVADLNRKLIERNSEIVECRHDARHYRGLYDQAQFASLNTQLQAFGSQLQEARQSSVNFGFQSGNAGRQSSTNNVA